MRDIRKTQTVNLGNRTLFESILAPEVVRALKDFSSAMKSGVLVGGLALSFYVKPRYTQDVDVLYASEGEIPDQVKGFKRHRAHAFEHRTGVEVEVLSSAYINASSALVQKVIETAVDQSGIKVTSPSGLVALKLGRLNARDRADIIDLIKNCTIDLTGFDLSQEKIAKYIALVGDAENDPD